MDFTLSELYLEDRERYRSFAQSELSPYVRQMDEEERTPPQILTKLREHRLLGIPLPAKFGGAGRDMFSATLCMEELSKVSPAVAGILNVTSEIVGLSLEKYGTAQQQEKYLPEIATGRAIGAFAITEPGAGSDTAAAKTAAVDAGDHWVLNGTKLFITNSEIAGLFLIGAKTALPDGKKKLTMFIVERGFPGFAVGKAEHKMGLRASSTCELILEDCIVPKENRLGELGKGMRIALGSLDGGRIMIAAQGLGIAQGCIDAATAFLKAPTGVGRLSRQGVQFTLADLQTKTDAARLLVYQAASLHDQGRSYTREAAMAKLFATETANEVARTCVQLMGHAGCTTDYPVEGLFRDAKITEIYEGTNEIQRMVIAGQMGLNA